MVTGDNLETAVSVSQEVGIIDQNHQDGFTYWTPGYGKALNLMH